MNLFCGNLSPETSEEHLRQIFSEFGNILSAKVIIDSATGLPKGFGFVEMEEKYDAYDAIDNLDMTYFMGNIISVKEAKPKAGPGANRGFAPRGGGNRSGGGNFNRTDRGGNNFNRTDRGSDFGRKY